MIGTHTLENNSNTIDEPNKLTEEEASRYDRQMRLWGLEAQQRYINMESVASTSKLKIDEFDRMRNATILVVRLKGTATEAIKNMVLAGIGKLVIVDSENVTEEDLGAGFFFRDEDVGKKVRFYYLTLQSVRPFTGNISGCIIRGLTLPNRELKA